MLNEEHIQYIAGHIREAIIMFAKDMLRIAQMYINRIGIGAGYWFMFVYGDGLLLTVMFLDILLALNKWKLYQWPRCMMKDLADIFFEAGRRKCTWKREIFR